MWISRLAAIGVLAAAFLAVGFLRPEFPRDEGAGEADEEESGWSRLEKAANEALFSGRFEDAARRAAELRAACDGVAAAPAYVARWAATLEGFARRAAAGGGASRSALAFGFARVEEMTKATAEFRYADALAAGDSALERFGAAALPEGWPLALVRWLRSSPLAWSGQYAAARSECEAAHAVLAAELGAAHPFASAAAEAAGRSALALGDVGAAVEWLERCLASREAAFGPSSPEIADTLATTAQVLIAAGRFDDAIARYARALDVRRAAGGPNDPATAAAAAQLGTARLQVGKASEARAPLEEAARLLRPLPDAGFAATRSSVLASLGHCVRALGDESRARTLFRESESIARSASLPPTLDRFETLAILAAAAWADDGEDMEPALDAMSRELLSAPSAESAVRARVASALGLYFLGRAESDPAAAERALAATRTVVENSPATGPWRPRALNGLARALLALRRDGEAETVLAEAQALLGEPGRGTAQDRMDVLSNLAVVRGRQGDFAGAERLAREALALGDGAGALPAGGRVRLRYNVGRALRHQGRYAAARDEIAAAAAAYREERPRSGGRGLHRVAFADDSSPLEFLAALEARLGNSEAAFAAIEEDASRGLLDEIAAREGRGSVERGVADWKSVQAALDESTAFLGWIDVPGVPLSADPGGERFLFVLRRTGGPRFFRLPGTGEGGLFTREDEDLPLRLVAALRERDPGHERLAAALRAQRIDPGRGALAGARRFLVGSLGAMAPVPLDLVLGGLPFSVALSGTLLVARNEGRASVEEFPNGSPTPPALVAVAANRTGRASAESLPAAAREVAALAAMIRPSRVLSGEAATESALASLAADGSLGGASVIHVSAHAELNDRAPMRSSIRLSPERGGAPDAAAPGPALFDGRLEARELLDGWRIGARLVTLGACRTLGAPRGSEGYLGFSQALLAAGARSALLTLDVVDDAATALLMTRFYENWLRRGMRKSDALADAKVWLAGLTRKEAEAISGPAPAPAAARDVRFDAAPRVPPSPDDRPYAHPAFWAPFVLVGDPD